jgi:hypothetical protein
LSFVESVHAQQNNLWTTEFGSRSALVGGAVTSSVRDNSAIYYNPGALGFIKNSNIGLSANIVNLYTYYIKNGAGEGKNFYYPNLNFVPQFISGVLKLERIPDVTFTYAAFSKQQSKIQFRQTSDVTLDLFSQFPGEEEFLSNYQYQNEIIETWVGIGAGYLLSENWSVGGSLFFSYRSEVSVEYIDNNVFDSNNEIVANTVFSNEFDLGQLGMIYKVGVAYEDDYINWGATVTTTSVRIGLFTGALLYRKENVEMPGVERHYYSINNEWTDARYKHPWEFDSGVEFALGRGTLKARITYFAPIRSYTVSEFDDEAVVSANTSPIYPDRNKIKYASKSIFNIGFGFERRLNKNVVLLTGIKIDRNVFDGEEVDSERYWVTSKSYWNLYTSSLGVDYRTKRGNNLIVGVSYRFSNRKDDEQLINITNPDPNNYLLGVKTNTADTNINGYSIVLGYTYNFGRNGKKDIREKINLDKLNPFEPKKK